MSGRTSGRTSGTSRRTFGPVLLAGLAAGALTAVATSRPAAEAQVDAGDVPIAEPPAADLPLAAALALVVLAAWGAALVTRRRVRRAALVLGLLAALGVVAALVVGLPGLLDRVREPYDAAGLVDVEVGLTGWYAATWVGTVVSLVTLVAAVRLAPGWPEMGSRYDAPAAAPPHRAGAEGTATSAAPVQDADGEDVDGARNLEWWKAIDEGRDPTAGPS